VKSVWEHASIGLSGSSVASDRQSLAEELQRRAGRGRDLFVEAYVEGREFNLALLEGPGGQPQVLPPAEIEFHSFPETKPRIVGYAAKWESGSAEFAQTPRRFDFPDPDRDLLERLRELALRCWQLCDLRGYARVDFRVDLAGRPWVLEVNANPCLSPDAGFLAAAERAGLSPTEVIRRIVEGARA
jgi:D-alanine-D-alanine ligase